MKQSKHYYTPFITTLFLLLFGHGVWGQVISQYVETNSGSVPKGIEIWNNTNSTLNFSTNNLIIQQGTNGDAPVNKVTISSGSLVSGAVLVIGTSDISTYLSGQSLTTSFTLFAFNFNGDDALVVKYGSVTTDIFGNPGSDPGSSWVGGSVSTANQNIELITGITSGATAGWTDPSSRFTTVSITPATSPGGLSGFGVAPVSNLTWTGATSTDWNTANNWNPAAVPTSNDNVIIPSLGIINFPVSTDLTIAAGKTVTLNSNSNLTVNGTLTNDGTLTLESGATLVQGEGNTVAGSGTFNVEQALTGETSDDAPSGRFWYLGSPVSGASSTVFNAASSNRLWTYSEVAQSYTEITANDVNMSPMQGHVVRLGANETSVFTGGILNTGDYTNTSLTNTGTAEKRGYHLLSNPYPSYLDWSAAYTGAAGISSTIWYRSYNTTNTAMVFDTYNATSSLAATNSSGTTTQYIPPMQAFWVYNPTDNTTGSITFSNSMRSHQANGGLKDIEDFPAFARLNLVDGDFIDQVVVYTDPNAKNKVDNYDSKKFLLPNKPQVYATVGDEQLVINGLKSGMVKTIVPLTVELPNAQVYTFEMDESYVENGSVILEDTQEGVFQDMGIHTIYQFSADAGVIANRFVLHFLLPTGNTSDSEDSQVGINDLTNAQIDVINNQQGSILVSISSDLQASGEIQILDAAGSLIQSKTISDHTTALAIKQGAGIYFVRVITPLKSEMKKIFIY